jgi:thiol-disulfide isomerase/thioredoxin
MKASISVLAVFVVAMLPSHAEAPTADQLLSTAKAKAVAEHKAVFVHFGASWCGWCRRLDAFLDRLDIKPVFEKYFVVVKLVVQENDKNKSLENPRADALLKRLGGPSGLPYSAFLDAQGALIVDSKRNGDGNLPKEHHDALRLAKRGLGAGEPNLVQMAPEMRNVAE